MESRGKSNAGASHTRHGATMQEAGAYVLRRPASCELSAQPVHSIGGSPSTSAASALPARGGGRGVFPSPAALSGLARGLTELSGALLTIARALQQLAPHPTSGSVAGPTVLGGPEDAARGESTEAPKRGAEPRRQPPASLRKPSPWTAERDAQLAAAWERGDEPAAILDAINAMPGASPVASELAIRARASQRKLRRSEAAMARTYQRIAMGAAGPRKWTEAAVALVREQYPNKQIPIEDIAAAVTALGVPMSAHGVMNYCQKVGILRPRGQVADRHFGGRRKMDRWSDERRDLLTALWPQGLTQTQMAEALNKLPGSPISAHQAGIYGLVALKLPKRGPQPRVDGKGTAAAAAQARGTCAPPPPEAVAAAPPAIPEPARAEPTNPARAAAVSTGPLPRPTAQSSAAAGGAPRPSMILGHNGARIDLPPVPAPTDDEPPPYDPSRKSSVESRVETAKRLIRKNPKIEAHIVVMQTRLPLREAMRIIGEVRRERAA